MTNLDWSFLVVPIAKFGGLILILSSLSLSMIKSRSVPVLSFAIWTGFMSFATGLDSIICRNDVSDKAPIWCDIGVLQIAISFSVTVPKLKSVSHVQLGEQVALPACTFAMTRNLYNIVCKKQVAMTSRA